MIVSAQVLTLLLWGAMVAVAVGALYLVVVLVIDWHNRRLW